MTAFGPFRQIALLRNDILLVPFQQVHHEAMCRLDAMVEQGRTSPHSLIGYMVSMGNAFRHIINGARRQDKYVVLYYTDADIMPHLDAENTPMRHRLKGSIDLRYGADALVVEAEGLIHVVKDRGHVVKPIIIAIHQEAPSMIGQTTYITLREE